MLISGCGQGCGVQIPDFLTLDQRLENTKRVLVVGGGFLGTELAVGMATRCKLFQTISPCHDDNFLYSSLL